MTPEQFKRVQDLFHEARKLPPSRWPAFLDQACPDDATVRAEVDDMLRLAGTGTGPQGKNGVEKAVGQAFVSAVGKAPSEDTQEIPQVAGTRIGQYTVLRMLGQGGMGVVFEAQQVSPRRRVALKVISPGMISKALLRRFEHESQILGRLQHPGVAQIYEAGTFDGGSGTQPFFAMEFIEGKPLTDFARENNLGTRQRLELMVKICQGVHHAHQKGIIHRDLKPGNILVDASGQPKILDFGVARATDSDIQTTTLQTDIGQLIGTIPYMSPEQAGGDPHDLDARSDVYALGVVAYELLAGELPYNLREKLIHEAVRIIREDDPTPLSSIDRALRGDVEIMVGKSLAKEKDRRYQSADEFASDISRFLRNEPITARAPSVRYQFSKFARRNKALVGGVTATFVMLVAGLIGTSYGLAQAVHARDAEAKQRQVAEAARKNAEERQKETEQVAEFQASQLSGIDTALMGVRLRSGLIAKRQAALEARNVEKRQIDAELQELEASLSGINFTNVALEVLNENIFERAIKAIEKDFADQPLVKARLLQTVATTLGQLGLLDFATNPQKEALSICRQQLGNDNPETLATMRNMGRLLRAQGKLSEAEPFVRESLESSRRLFGDDHPSTLASMDGMANQLTSQGKFIEAEALYRDAIEKMRHGLGSDHPDTLTFISNLASILQEQGKLSESEPLVRESFEGRQRVLGNDHPDTLAAINRMGNLFADQNKPKEAESYYRTALQNSRRLLGDDHPDTLSSINNVGYALRQQEKLSEAEPFFREALERRRRVLGDDHPDTLVSIGQFGNLLYDQGKMNEAEPYYREALERRRRVLGDDHPDTLTAISNMGSLCRALGKLDQSQRYSHEALLGFRRVLGDDHPRTLASINNMGNLLQAQGKLSQAEPFLRETLERSRRARGDDDPKTLTFIINLGSLLIKLDKLTEAEAFLREAVERSRRIMGGDHPLTLAAGNNMGLLLRAQGKLSEAEPYLREVLDRTRSVLGDDHPNTLISISSMGSLLQAQHKPAEAIALLAQAEPAIRLAFTGANAVRVGRFLTALGRARTDSAEFGPAEANLIEAQLVLNEATAATAQDRAEILTGLVDLYEAWHTSEPDEGYDKKAAEWREKYDAYRATTQPAATQPAG